MNVPKSVRYQLLVPQIASAKQWQVCDPHSKIKRQFPSCPAMNRRGIGRWRNGAGRGAASVTQRPTRCICRSAEFGIDRWREIADGTVRPHEVVVVLPDRASPAALYVPLVENGQSPTFPSTLNFVGDDSPLGCSAGPSRSKPGSPRAAPPGPCGSRG